MGKRKTDGRQLAFSFDVAIPAPVLADPIAALKAAGVFGKNGASYCTSWGTVRDESVPYSPRSFGFPCTLLKDETTGAWRLYLSTPANSSNRLVRRIAEVTGLTPEWGRVHAMDGRWHHAVDLADDKGIDRLLGSLEHTTLDMALDAIGFGVHCGRLSSARARAALSALGVEEPSDRSHGLLSGRGMEPNRMNGSPGICVGRQFTSPQKAWSQIHAIEDGWVSAPTVDGRGNTKKYSVVTPDGWRRRGEAPPAKYAKAA